MITREWRWDQDILKSLAGLSQRVRPVGDQLEHALGPLRRLPGAVRGRVDPVDHGERKWIDEPGIDSCHTVWFELHEDLLATLGLER